MARMISDPSQATLYDQLRDAILSGTFRPGTVLTEMGVAESFGVSRTPVREALQALERDGILQRNGRRLMVKVTTLEEVMELYDCRIALEGVAGGWAARSRTESDLMLLELALDDMRQAADKAPMELVTVNHNFHDRLWRAGHNNILVDMLTRLKGEIMHFPERTVSQPGRWTESISEHAAILEAVRQRDEAAASRLSSEHMVAARNLRLKLVRGSQQ